MDCWRRPVACPPAPGSGSMSALDDPLPPVAELCPPHDGRVRWDDYLTRGLLFASERVARGSGVPTVDIDTLRAQLRGFDFQTPRELGELVPWTIAQLEHGVVHMTNPR